jgi:hypothetical protein
MNDFQALVRRARLFIALIRPTSLPSGSLRPLCDASHKREVVRREPACGA